MELEGKLSLKDISKELYEIWYLRCTGFEEKAWERFDRLRRKVAEALKGG